MRWDTGPVCGSGLFKYYKQNKNSLEYSTNTDAYLPDIHKLSCSDESSLTRLVLMLLTSSCKINFGVLKINYFKPKIHLAQ